MPKCFPEDPKLGSWVETQYIQYKCLQQEVDATSRVKAVQPNKQSDNMTKFEIASKSWHDEPKAMYVLYVKSSSHSIIIIITIVINTTKVWIQSANIIVIVVLKNINNVIHFTTTAVVVQEGEEQEQEQVTIIFF